MSWRTALKIVDAYSTGLAACLQFRRSLAAMACTSHLLQCPDISFKNIIATKPVLDVAAWVKRSGFVAEITSDSVAWSLSTLNHDVGLAICGTKKFEDSNKLRTSTSDLASSKDMHESAREFVTKHLRCILTPCLCLLDKREINGISVTKPFHCRHLSRVSQRIMSF